MSGLTGHRTPPASISEVLSGRRMPTRDFVISLVRALLTLAEQGQPVGRGDPRLLVWRQHWLDAKRQLEAFPSTGRSTTASKRRADRPLPSPRKNIDSPGPAPLGTASGERPATNWAASPSSVSRRQRDLLNELLTSTDSEGRRWGDAKWGCYALYDHDGEPLWLGAARETIRIRLRRILVSQRSDATALGLLDVSDIAEIEVWPLWQYQLDRHGSAAHHLSRLESTLYTKLTAETRFHALLSENVAQTEPVSLPESHRGAIVDHGTRPRWAGSEARVARLAHVVSRLAERLDETGALPSHPSRRALSLHASRLQSLAAAQFLPQEPHTPPSA
ncbi:hypothetical protein [Streptomyces sp. NPDC050263]|uniref:hypothetical protein n=1 Tax=Streptomyces sp. NPDC050263 TaxID=3155037 RepID=UPI00342F415F